MPCGEVHFDHVNVATAFTQLSKMVKQSVKAARAARTPELRTQRKKKETRREKRKRKQDIASREPLGPALGLDARYHALFDLASKHCAAFRAREVANVMNALMYLETEGGCGGGKRIDEALARDLVAAVKREAGRLDPQHVSLVYNAVCAPRGSRVLQRAMSDAPEAWNLLAMAAREQAPLMEPKGLALMLNAMSKVDEAFGAVGGKIGWSQLCTATTNKTNGMEAQGIAMTAHALGKIESMRSHMSPKGWRNLAQGVEHTAPTMTAAHVSMVFHALARLKECRDAMKPSNWVAMARAVEREAPAMNPLNVATVYHGLALTKGAQTAMTVRAGGWDALSKALALRAHALDMNSVKLVFNALGMMEPARGAMTKQAWTGAFGAVERVVAPSVPKRDGNEKRIADTLLALLVPEDHQSSAPNFGSPLDSYAASASASASASDRARSVHSPPTIHLLKKTATRPAPAAFNACICFNPLTSSVYRVLYSYDQTVTNKRATVDSSCVPPPSAYTPPPPPRVSLFCTSRARIKRMSGSVPGTL